MDEALPDADVYRRIRDLVGEEHDLREDPDVDPDTRAAAVARVEAALDQCWDLLRQRRARREFGEDPDSAQVRSVDEVEGYRQ